MGFVLFCYCMTAQAEKSLFRREKDKVRVNLRTRTEFNIKNVLLNALTQT